MPRLSSIMTQKISLLPANAPDTPPKQNIRVLPMKNAMTVVHTADLLVFAKRVKLGVEVPPLTKEPMTRPTPENIVRPPVDFSKIAVRPPPCTVAVTIA